MAQGILNFVKIAPPSMRRFFLEDGFGLATPLGLMSLAYNHPFILFLFFSFPALFYHGEISSAREKGILALILSKPIARSNFLLNLLLAEILGIILLGLSCAIGVMVSFQAFNVTDPLTNFLLAIVNLIFLTLFLGGISLAIAVLTVNAGQATGWMIGVPLILYLLEFVGKSLKQIAFISPINPFHYYNPQKVISVGRIAGEDAGFLIAGTIVLTGLSFIGFRRTEI
jgi:ABC-type transport system involved in multi-copper enzyme maturation permease subunit